MSIPADAGNRHYAAMVAQVITPAAYVEPAPTADQVRAERDSKLAATDWMALSDVTMSPEWAAYRQALRDITGQAGFPEAVDWPVKP
jgi:transposase